MYLIETVQQLRDQRRARTGCAEGIHETEMIEISNEAACTLGRESQRVTPEIPLERDDGE